MVTRTQYNKIAVQVTGDKETRKLVAELNKIARSNKEISRTSKATSDALIGLQSVFAGFAGLSFVGDLVKATDTLQLLRDRINAFTGDAKETNRVFENIFEAAKFTRTSVQSLSETFNRLALSTKDLGLTTDQVLAFSVALQQSFRIGGASVSEMTGSIIQLSQGLSSGQLRGQELRSVLEANVVVAEALADALNVKRGQLIKEAEKGSITAAVVIQALAMKVDELNTKAGKLNITFEQFGNIVRDQFSKRLLEIRDNVGFTKFLETALGLIVRFRDELLALGAALASIAAVASASGLITLVKLAIVPLGALGGTVLALTAALIGFGTWIALNWDKTVTYVKLGALTMDKAMSDFGISLIENIRKAVTTSRDYLFSFINGILEKLGRDPIEVNPIVFDNDVLNKLSGQSEQAGASIARLRGELEQLNKREGSIDFAEFVKQQFQEMMEGLKGTTTLLGKFGATNEVFRTKGFLAGFAAKSSDSLITLRNEVNAAKISVDDFYVSLVKLQGFFKDDGVFSRFQDIILAGTVQYMNSLKGLNAELVDVVSGSWKRLEEELLNFIKKGKFSFKDFSQFILDELNKVLIRYAIVRPLASAVTGALDPYLNSSSVPNGSVGYNYTQGGISSTVAKATSGGNFTGMSKTSSPVNLTVNNNAPVEVQTSESISSDGSRSIDLLIVEKTKQAFASGSLDRTMTSLYGVKRRGI